MIDTVRGDFRKAPSQRGLSTPNAGGVEHSRSLFASWGEFLRFDLLLLAFLILGTRLATLLHEFLGHALTTLIGGGKVNAVHVSLLGGGRVLHDLPDGAGLVIRMVVACAGIGINILTGALILHRFRRPEAGGLWTGFWILFAGASLLGGTAYAALGFYYGQGDPVAWMGPGSSGASWACLPFLAVAPFLGFAAVKAFSAWAAQWFPSRSFTERIVVLALTAGAAAGVYGGLYHANGARSRALDAPEAAFVEAQHRVAQAKAKALAQHLRRTNPDMTEAQVQRLVQETPIVVRPEEVPRKLPLKAVLALLYGAGGMAALYRAGPCPQVRKTISPEPVILAIALACGVLAILAASGGWLYGAPGILS